MRRQRGFTLIEVVVAMVLLGTMMLLLYSGLNFSLRSWDAGNANGQRVADWRLSENFLRREVSEIYPMRFVDPGQLKYAFDGKAHELRFVSSRRPGVTAAGLSLVSIDVEPGKEPRTRDLVMRRASATGDVRDFSALDQAQATVLLPDVDSVQFAYFGSDTDFTEPAWNDEWKIPFRMPLLVRMTVRNANGEALPEMLVKLMVDPQAGCYENVFQRECRPRRPATP